MKLVVSNVVKIYDSVKVLNNVSIQFSNGVYGLIGPNGAGKSTLMRLMVGIEKVNEGIILYDDKPISMCPDCPHKSTCSSFM